MRSHVILRETYTEDNVALLRYFLNNDADPYPVWWYICQVLKGKKSLAHLSRLLGEPITSADELNDMDPGFVWKKLPPKVQKTVMERALAMVSRDAPAEAPTKSYMSLVGARLLPRTTWLVHFSNQADAIKRQGFVYGMDDMDRLGLTTHFTNGAKKFGGYNFAYVADSRYAVIGAREDKYGEHAVVFQNAGVLVDHWSDEEQQVIFYGKDVSPRNLIELRGERDGTFGVVPVVRIQNREYLFSGKYPAVIQWIQTNHQQYRTQLYGR